MPFHLTEPHPSIKTPYIQTGRGGAGNYTTVDPTTLTSGPHASGPASRHPYPTSSNPRRFVSGRGGAGNVHSTSERAIFSFDEELAHEQRLQERAAPVYHCGRGGAGNVGGGFGAKSGRQGSASSDLSVESAGSSERVKKSLEGAWGRVSGAFSRGS
ncbi:MAG: hypothetical protein M1820_002489 [Bogoriella megaspora]|nr:MAG: hypothetical protein M1820_002489 [Bogoriella megaspora]